MKNEEHQAGGGFYSVYSIKRRFEALRVFWAFSVVRMHRHGRIGSLFSIDERFPKLALARGAMNVSFGAAILRGIFAGWLIAMVVWMLAAIDYGRVAVIVILTYVVGLAELTHIIAGSVEVLFLAMIGDRSWWSIVWGYLIPTLIGNIIGGVSLTAAVNHAQVVAGMNKNNKLE